MTPFSVVPSTHRQTLLGITLAVLAAIGFSGKAILVKLAYQQGVDAVSLLALRMVFSVPLFMAAALWSRTQKHAYRIQKRDWGAIVALGLIGYYLSSLLDFVGLAYISASLERLVLFLYPTLVVILSAWWFKRTLLRHETIALAVSYVGIVLVFLQDTSTVQNRIVLGTVLIFGCTLTYSIYLIAAEPLIARIGSIRFTAYAMLVASAATILQFACTHPIATIQQSARIYALSIAMALFSTVLPVFMLSAGIRLIGSGQVALIGSVGPVSTLAMAHLFLGETISGLQCFGSLLVLAGVLLISIKSARKDSECKSKTY